MSAVRKPRPSRAEHVTTFWINKELRDKIAAVAEKRGISRSELVREAVETHLAKKGGK